MREKGQMNSSVRGIRVIGLRSLTVAGPIVS